PSPGFLVASIFPFAFAIIAATRGFLAGTIAAAFETTALSSTLTLPGTAALSAGFKALATTFSVGFTRIAARLTEAALAGAERDGLAAIFDAGCFFAGFDLPECLTDFFAADFVATSVPVSCAPTLWGEKR